MHNVTLKCVHEINVDVEKQEVLHIQRACLYSCPSQHVMRMHRIILPSVACPALTYFSTLSRKWHEFRRKMF